MSFLSEFFKKVKNYLENTHKSVSIAWGGLIFLPIACIDYLVSPEISLSLLYVLPVTIFTWFVRIEAGLITAVLSAIAQLVSLSDSQPVTLGSIAPYWNTGATLIFLLTISYLLFELRKLRDKEKELARIDRETGVANKRLFFELAWLEIKKSFRYRHPLTIVYFDADDFTKVNKTWGCSISDKLLKTAADTIKNNIRETDLIARIGVDEFVILLPGSGFEPAEVVIRRVQKALAAAMDKNKWSVTFSIAAITFINPPKSVEEMLQPVDHLMYTVKNNGKNQCKHKTSI